MDEASVQAPVPGHAPGSAQDLLSGMDEISVWCPVPLRTHPAGADALDEPARRWAVGHGLCSEESVLARARIGAFVAAGMSFLTRDAAAAMTCYSYWALAWDDELDTRERDLGSAVALTGEINRLLYEPAGVPPSGLPAPGDRFAAALRDVRRMWEGCLSPDGFAAVRSENTYWLDGQLWKIALQLRGSPPGLGEYLRMRWPKAGCGPLCAYTAPGAGYAMSPAELYDPLVRTFSHAVFLPCTVINDLVGMFKEEAAGQAHVNIVSALAAEHGLSTADALVAVWELYERLVALMLRLRERLLADPRPAVARYAAELPHWLSATLHWTATSLRYLAASGAGATTPSRTPPKITTSDGPLLCDRDDLTPPPYPDIAWLWEHATP